MQLLTMGAKSFWRPFPERAFTDRLKRLKALEGAIVQAQRALSVTTNTAQVFSFVAIFFMSADPAMTRRRRHWLVMKLRISGQVNAVLLREDGVLVEMMLCDNEPYGLSVPIDLQKLSLWQIGRIIRRLKRIGRSR